MSISNLDYYATAPIFPRSCSRCDKKTIRNNTQSCKRITETIRQIPEEPFSAIDFVETSLGDVMAGFVPENGEGTNGGVLIDARLLSDGTLRMLAVVTALETVPARSRIIIEEFDNGLHPSRARLLVQKLDEAAKRRQLNVLVTTHNPAFMDALDESQMNNALLCHRDESRGAVARDQAGGSGGRPALWRYAAVWAISSPAAHSTGISHRISPKDAPGRPASGWNPCS